jgi:2-polyprenyl-6-methoxyphenol hydroxylase-like FAD-dependent oxidoreductase
LREIGTANFEDIGCEYEFQCSLPQWRTEAILREHLECLGLEIEYGTDVRSIEDHPAGLRVTLEARGTTEVLTTAYVLGAGGAHSVTRHSMQDHLEGETYDGRYIVADVKLWPFLPARMRPRHRRTDWVRAALAAAGRSLAYFCQSRRG